ncbi:MAG: META domain-containing protein [Candidatus Nanopelagicales bacterium]
MSLRMSPLTRRFTILAVAVATTASLGSSIALAAPAPAPITTLSGSTWTLSAYASASGKRANAVASAAATLRFIAGGSVSGSTGCNNFNGTYTQSGNSLSIKIGPMTLRACPGDLAVQESAVLAAFPKIVTFSSDQTATAPAVALLVLKDARHATQLSYKATEVGLPGTSWQATGVNNGKQAVVSDSTVAAITANFGANGRLTGSGGCNNYSARYSTRGKHVIWIGPVASTMMACAPEVMTMEQNFFTALGKSSSYTREGGQLTLRGIKGSTQATFTTK